MNFIKQCKAKDIKNMSDKLIKKYLNGDVYTSHKYDGNYVQIVKVGTDIRLYSSSGKEFNDSKLKAYIARYVHIDIVVMEAEYIGTTFGKLGDRVHCSINSFIDAFKKGRELPAYDGKYVIFDLIAINSLSPTKLPFRSRLEYLKRIPNTFKFDVASYVHNNTLEQARDLAKLYIKDGWEGAVVKSTTHLQEPGKRVNTACKIKAVHTAVLTCYGANEGTGKYARLIGSLLLEDEDGISVKVGSGLSDNDRLKAPSYFIGKEIEIEYFDKHDTYIQPIFKRRLGEA